MNLLRYQEEYGRLHTQNRYTALIDGIGWPQTTPYFLPATMDSATAHQLIRKDSSFLGKSNDLESTRCVDLTANGISVTDLVLGKSNKALDVTKWARNSSRILFIDQRRRYFDTSTHIEVDLHLDTWLKLLHDFKIPPIALELLHENNGGCFQHISYCDDNPEAPCDTPSTAKPCAYQICFKLCVWNFEHLIYARYDFHTETTFVLVAGTSMAEQVQRLEAQFSAQQDTNLFTILQSLACVWASEVENERWHADFLTQKFEGLTGVSAMHEKPLPNEKFRLRTDMASAQDTIRCIARASFHTGEMFKFLQESLWRFYGMLSEQGTIQPSKRHYQQLSDALEMRINLQHNQCAQIANLMTRLKTQWEVVNAVISHYNNDLNIGMARDSRQDSQLMRRIAFVTIVFLPATFMATFFSMGFFEVENGDLSVSRWIWLYVVCTVPLTALLAWQYAPRSELFARLTTSWWKEGCQQTDSPTKNTTGIY